MPPTKPDRPPSRPPLTTRIRNSFESKRRLSSDGRRPGSATGTHSEAEKANGVVVAQDAEVLRDAVDRAINSEAFQNAIAANLARLIKPGIRDALDTLQPVVEAVVSHEVILRRIQGGVVDTPGRMNEGETKDREIRPVPEKGPHVEDAGGNSRMEARLGEIAAVVKAHSGRLAEVVDGISGIRTNLGPTRTGIDDLKSFSDQSSISMSAVQAQLDHLWLELGEIKTAVGTGLEEVLAATKERVTAQDLSFSKLHMTKLDSITTDLAALQEHSDSRQKLETISTNLEALKDIVQAGITSSNERFATIIPQITTILTSVEGHATSLADLKDADTTPQIWAAVQRSNESHDSHTVALHEIRQRSMVPAAEKASEYTLALETLTAELASLKENMQAGLTSNDENMTAVRCKIDGFLTMLETHRATDSSPAILEAVHKSNDSHTAHTEALETLKSRDVDASFFEVLTSLEPQLVTMINILEAHTASHISHAAALEGVRSLSETPTSSSPSDLEQKLDIIIRALESHGAVHTIHAGALESYAAALEGVRALHTEASSSLESLDLKLDKIISTLQLHTGFHASHKATLEGARFAKEPSASLEPKLDTIISSLTSHTESHISHTETLEVIRSTGAGFEPQPELQPQITTIINTLESQTAALEEMKLALASGVDAVPSSNTDSILAPHMNSIVSILESHYSLLNEIKYDISAEILSTLHDIKDSHVVHQSALTEIREADMSDEILTALHSSNESHATHAKVLDELKSARTAEPVDDDNTEMIDFGPIMATLAEHTSTLAVIKDASASLTDSHSVNAATLAEIKQVSLTSDKAHASHAATLAELKDIAATSRDSHTAHTTILGEIKEIAGVSRDSHAVHTRDLGAIRDAVNCSKDMNAAHASKLEEIRGLHDSHDVKFAELKAASSIQPANVNCSDLETHLSSISAVLDSQTATLTYLTSTNAIAEVLQGLNVSHDLLNSHTVLLNSLKSSSSHEDILNNISTLKLMAEHSKSDIDAHGQFSKDLHDSTNSSHSELVSAIAGLAVGGAGASMLADHDNVLSKETLAEIKSVKEIVERSAAQIDVNHFTITTLNDELKRAIHTSEFAIKRSLMDLGEGIDTRATSAGFESHGTGVAEDDDEDNTLTGRVLIIRNHLDLLHGNAELDDRRVEQFQYNEGAARLTAADVAAGGLVASGLAASALALAAAHEDDHNRQEFDDETTPTAEEAPSFENASFEANQLQYKGQVIAEDDAIGVENSVEKQTRPESQSPTVVENEPTVKVVPSAKVEESDVQVGSEHEAYPMSGDELMVDEKDQLTEDSSRTEDVSLLAEAESQGLHEPTAKGEPTKEEVTGADEATSKVESQSVENDFDTEIKSITDEVSMGNAQTGSENLHTHKSHPALGDILGPKADEANDEIEQEVKRESLTGTDPQKPSKPYSESISMQETERRGFQSEEASQHDLEQPNLEDSHNAWEKIIESAEPKIEGKPSAESKVAVNPEESPTSLIKPSPSEQDNEQVLASVPSSVKDTKHDSDDLLIERSVAHKTKLTDETVEAVEYGSHAGMAKERSKEDSLRSPVAESREQHPSYCEQKSADSEFQVIEGSPTELMEHDLDTEGSAGDKNFKEHEPPASIFEEPISNEIKSVAELGPMALPGLPSIATASGSSASEESTENELSRANPLPAIAVSSSHEQASSSLKVPVQDEFLHDDRPIDEEHSAVSRSALTKEDSSFAAEEQSVVPAKESVQETLPEDHSATEARSAQDESRTTDSHAGEVLESREMSIAAQEGVPSHNEELIQEHVSTQQHELDAEFTPVYKEDESHTARAAHNFDKDPGSQSDISAHDQPSDQESTPHVGTAVQNTDASTGGGISPIEEYELFCDESQPHRSALGPENS